jgi:hypothetical protein
MPLNILQTVVPASLGRVYTGRADLCCYRYTDCDKWGVHAGAKDFTDE